nr:Ger(x)C family spore germination protein [Paenibacillus swuensis]
MYISRVLPFLLFSILLSGCWDRREVNDMALIIAAGIDVKEGDQVELTVQVFIPNPTAGEGGGGGEGRIHSISRVGENVSAALTSLQRELPRSFFWGHAKAYIVGEEASRRGMNHIMDFLFRDIDPREQSNLFVCRGKAKDLLLSLTDPNSYETMIKLSQKKPLQYSTVFKVEEKISGESNSFLLPIAGTTASSVSGQEFNIIMVRGCAVIKNRKLLGFLEKKDWESLEWFENRKFERNMTVLYEDEKGQTSLKLTRSYLHYFPRIHKGVWSMHLRIKVNADIAESSNSLDFMSTKDNLKKAEPWFNKKIQQEVTQIIREGQKKYSADIFGFAREFHKAYPEQWKKEKRNWERIFSDMPVTVEIDTVIHTPGISNINQLTDKIEQERE